MAIKIKPEPDIHLSQAELDRYRHDYNNVCMYTVDPPSFEVWLRSAITKYENFTL